MSTKRPTQAALAYFYTAGYFCFLGVVLFTGIPETARELTGLLSAAQLAIINYYFGSSHGSAQKTELLNPHAPDREVRPS